MGNKIKFLQEDVTQINTRLSEVQESLPFIERSLPLLTHIQMCEGLQAIAVDNI